jgi:transposase
MSGLSVSSFFPFRRLNVFHQDVNAEVSEAHIMARADLRFTPVCQACGNTASGVHSWTRRKIRDLNMATATVWVTCIYRKVFCPHCQGIHVEELGLMHPYLRVSTRLARYVYQLCQVMTITEVAKHLGLDWKTVKAIDKQYLERDFGQPDYEGLRILAVDEISLRKGRKYLTVVLDYETGRVVYVGKKNKARTLIRFFNQLKPRQRKAIDAVVMDMWDPFIKAVKKKLPNAKIVFDLFHVVAAFGRVIDKIRNSEYRKASKQDKTVFKGAKYLLLKNRKNVRRQSHRRQLQELLELNEVINTVMILKDKLKHIWSYRSRTWAAKTLDSWCDLARSLDNKLLSDFAAMLDRHRYGIVNHCDFPIHTGKIEGVNNKIKVIKRKAYGFHDLRYFTLKIYQAFSN